jgi:hypothetical protein
MGNFCESCMKQSGSSSGYDALADGAPSGAASGAAAGREASSHGAQHKPVPIVNEIVAVQAPPDLASSYQPSGGGNGAPPAPAP